MSEECDMTFDDILTKFARLDTFGFIVWGTDIDRAHKREIAAKDAEIARLKAALKTCVDYVKMEYGCGDECRADCEEINDGCNLREWTIEFGLETLAGKGGEENGRKQDA